MKFLVKSLSFQCPGVPGVRRTLGILLKGVFCCALVSCGDSNDSGYVPIPDPIITIEEIAPSQAHPKGLFKVQMEDVLLELSREMKLTFRGAKPAEYQPYIWVCWVVEESRLITRQDYSCDEGKGYLATLKFKAGRVPSQGYYQNLSDDFSTLPNYPNVFDYTLRPSEEFPDLQEFYVHKLKKAYAYVLTLDYEDQVTDRVGKQRIHCFPRFREEEKVMGYVPNNDLCGYGVSVSPHVHLSVRFDSHVMPQIKQFEQQVYQFVKSLIIKKGS